MKSYLLWYAYEHNNFRNQEFESLASLLNIDFSYCEQPSDKPFLLIKTSCEFELLKLMERTVLARSLFELWAIADSERELYAQLENSELCKPFKCTDSSFRIQVETFGRKLSLKTKVEKIEKLDFLSFKGHFDLKNAEYSFNLFEYYGNDPNDIPLNPYQLLFGRWISDSNRKRISNISLKTRKFIANTSMDPTLSLIMANIAKVKNCDLVFDPFVGSGSLLVAAADYGAYVFGSDINYLLLNGLSKPTRFGVKQRDNNESILTNLKQYGLEAKYLDVVVADASLPVWRSEPVVQFDAIITDPPYGKRESKERVGSQKNYKIPDNLISGHIPSKIDYNIDDIITDLLNFSALHLKIGGRLVFWSPFDRINKSFEFDINTLSHSCMKLISICEQKLSLNNSRVLIIMEKKQEIEK